MGTPLEFPQTFVAAGGAAHNVEIKAARRGTIQRFRVIQLSGALAGFEYALFNRRLAAPDDGTLSADAELYRITPYYAVDAAKSGGEDSAEGKEFARGLAYANHDGGSSNALQRLYLRITPGGSGAKTFGVGLLIEDSL